MRFIPLLERFARKFNLFSQVDYAEFLRRYQRIHDRFHGHTMEWVRFENNQEFERHYKDLMYVAVVLISIKTEAQVTLSIQSGYTEDYTHAYAWCTPTVMQNKTRITLDDKVYNGFESLFEVRFPIQHHTDHVEMRLRFKELSFLPYEEFQIIHETGGHM